MNDPARNTQLRAAYNYYNMDQVVGQALATYGGLPPRLQPAVAAA